MQNGGSSMKADGWTQWEAVLGEGENPYRVTVWTW